MRYPSLPIAALVMALPPLISGMCCPDSSFPFPTCTSRTADGYNTAEPPGGGRVGKNFGCGNLQINTGICCSEITKPNAEQKSTERPNPNDCSKCRPAAQTCAKAS